MGKLKVFSGKDVCKILAENGFEQVRQKGSHIVMQKKGTYTITVPVPDHKELRVGTLRSIIRQSDLDKKLFEE
ncbi:MAG: type II toxin-antitoxin system HicA family toxin [Spirochaetota bacterium]